MKDEKHNERRPAPAVQEISEPIELEEDDRLYIAEAEGIDAASRELTESALRFWARRGVNPDDEIIRFLALMTKKVITGEIRDYQDFPF